MLSDHQAGELRFAGVGAQGTSADDAAQQLATALRDWSGRHSECRIEQLCILPAVPAAVGSAAASHPFGAVALLVYVESSLTPRDAAEAVAAAVEEIRDAQALPDDEERSGLG